jgi:hypothetical protein
MYPRDKSVINVNPINGGVTTAPARARFAERYGLHYLATIIAPFLMLLVALRHPFSPASRNIVWLFMIFFGTVFYLDPLSSADSVRYAASLAGMAQSDTPFSLLWDSFFAVGSREQDIYSPIVTYLVSRLTSESWLLFGAYAVLLGYVMSRNIWFLIDRAPRERNFLLIFYIAVFAFYVDFGSSLNGVRMWTALHVFVFGILHYYGTGGRKFLLALLATPLIHFSFWLPLVLFAIFLVVRRFSLGIYTFFVASFFVSELEFDFLRTLTDYLPIQLQDRSAGYFRQYELNPDLWQLRQESTIWFLTLNSALMKYFFLLASTYLVWSGYHKRVGLIREFLSIGMLIYGFINLVSYIPSVGRFYSLGGMFIIAAIVLFIAATKSERRVAYVWPLWLLSAFVFIELALGIRFTLGFTSIWVLVGNFFFSPFVSAEASLYDSLF